MKRNLLIYIFLVVFVGGALNLNAQRRNNSSTTTDTLLKSSALSGLKFRSIGPSFASGRVADFAVNPNNFSEWYIAFASGGIWKTINNGQTFDPIFDNYGSYAIGCLAIDPTNTNVIWAGTGENNHQRALGYGDGVYKSVDRGKSWKNMGLKESRQIGMIAINPQNPNIVFVAAEGSAWGPGGDRGLYKTTDGGQNWTKVLEISENTGVNNVVIDPNNPQIMYATSEQRRRRQFTKIGGGPETAFYKSDDGGDTWRKISAGLPGGHLGGMGIAISPVNTDYVFLIIEAQDDNGGFYRSTDRGESWQKMSSYTTSGQYYNEIYCDPINIDKIYSMATYSKYSDDAGKTWKSISNNNRHVDDHAFWVNPTNTQHFIIGGDGGAYITYDGGANYFHVGNLATTQYYRVAVDNQKPFYWVYGGTQDNNSHAGPSQSLVEDGIPNSEWITTLGGDGFWSTADPTNPNIIYAEYQYGNIFKYFKNTGEKIKIKPFPLAHELTYRWNWDAPFLISHSQNTRLYMAANKVFRSDDGGLSWKTISNDLTAQIDRNSFPVMGKFWSSNAVKKDISTSQYGTIVTLAESTLKPGLLYVGTDDGIIQICDDATADNPTWRKISKFPGVPEYTLVSDIYPSNFDENVVFATFNNEKSNDLKPYVLKSSDKGATWTLITKGLPENGPVYSVVQDFEKDNLIFCGTEFGFYTSVDAGENWIKFSNGLPTIAVRDIALQKDQCDIAIATFGRSFYILDDYSALRTVSEDFLQNNDAFIFDIPVAEMYMPKGGRYGQGATYYNGTNPDFGANITFYLKDVPKTQKQTRLEKEKELFKNGDPIPQLTWRQMEDEAREIAPYLVFTIADQNGNEIRKINKKPSKGINRFDWDLHFPGIYPQGLTSDFDPFKNSSSFIMVMPGTYKVKMGMVVRGEYTDLTDYKSFEVKPLTNLNLTNTQRQEFVDFQIEVMDMLRIMWATLNYQEKLRENLTAFKQVAASLPSLDFAVMQEIDDAIAQLDTLHYKIYGVEEKASWEEVPPQILPIWNRMQVVLAPHWQASHTITQTERDNFVIVKNQFGDVHAAIKNIGQVVIPNLQQKLIDAGAPGLPGVLPDWN
ncbi:MAG: hypothetical protein JXL97_03215 [Bacteroidales bacterium]|nr:hypothetical protein [Bacteroidales bacterium]